MSDTDSAFDIAKQSLIGSRAHNQDRCQVLRSDSTLLLSIADGLGGHPRGDAAAQLLIDVAEHLFRKAEKPLEDPVRFMLRVIGKAHRSILRFGRRQRPPIEPRTTAVLAIVQNETLYWSHVGDSRLYLVRNGRVLARTADHTVTVTVPDNIGPIPRRTSLTRCLGGLEKPPTTTCAPPMALQPGDVVLLCTDGLWGQVPGRHLVSAFHDHRVPIAEQLEQVSDVAHREAHSDNVTAIALRWNGAGDDALPPLEARQPDLQANINID
ncbi:MAG: serine/threonine-protein phosphatase [Gammaproteobacteria bacterium]|nr:serine/threonine-protein phosphatase [Gammaproteobacteria bacterium]